MTEMNLYKTYADESILTSNPIGLVVALYEGAIESSITARECLAAKDIPARTKAINKIIAILTELMVTLNDEKGGEVSANLRRMYVYIQGRVLEAHMKQKAEPLEEIERLLGTMLEGWREASGKYWETLSPSATVATPTVAKAEEQSEYSTSTATYGNYVPDAGDYSVSSAYSF